MPKKFAQDRNSNAKLSLTLTHDASEEMRRLASSEGITLAELVRRSIGCYGFVSALPSNEELCIRDTETGEITRVRLISI